jgi:AcrR family transcriptional regulator
MTATRRELTRAATVEEIKRTAFDLMRRNGTTAVSFADIAREMRMTAPALYRYFAGRDDLLTTLIATTYDELGEQLRTHREAVPAEDPGGRLVALCDAYRAWAVEHPERLALLSGLPIPGYAAPEDGPTIGAARRAMSNFHSLHADAAATGSLRDPLLCDCTPALRRELSSPGHKMSDVPPAVAAGMLHAWAMLQGFVSLEAYGNLAWIDQAARDDLFVNHVRLIAGAIGLPAPADGWTRKARRRARA